MDFFFYRVVIRVKEYEGGGGGRSVWEILCGRIGSGDMDYIEGDFL